MSNKKKFKATEEPAMEPVGSGGGGSVNIPSLAPGHTMSITNDGGMKWHVVGAGTLGTPEKKEPVGSKQHKDFIDGFRDWPTADIPSREQMYDELSEAAFLGIPCDAKPVDEWAQREDLAKVEVSFPLFDELADAALERVRSTYTCTKSDGRGAQYGDTMRECQFLTTKAVDNKIDNTHKHYRLAIFLAGMVDMKLERMRGGYKDDILIDLIAYGAALEELMRRV